MLIFLKELPEKDAALQQGSSLRPATSLYLAHSQTLVPCEPLAHSTEHYQSCKFIHLLKLHL